MNNEFIKGERVHMLYGVQCNSEKLCYVDSITKAGNIKADGKIFTPSGREMASGWYVASIYKVSEKEIVEIIARIRRKNINYRLKQIDWETCSDYIIEKVYKIVKEAN